MKMALARRLGVLGMVAFLAFAVGGTPVAAQQAGRILSTNSPEYQQVVNQEVRQNFINQFNAGCGFGFCPVGFNGGQFYNGQQFFYGGQPFYGGQQFTYAPAPQFYNGQQFGFGGTPFYGGQQFFYGNQFGGGTFVPNEFFTAVGCEVGNYSCYYSKVGFR